MTEKGQPGKAEQQRRQVLRARPTGVRQRVSRGLEHVVMVVCELPAPTPGVRDVRDLVRAQAMLGDNAVGSEGCARGGPDDGARAPMDRSSIGPTPQEDGIDVPLRLHCRAAAMPMAGCTLGDPGMGLPKRQPLSERGMSVRGARQDDIVTLWQGQRTKRLLAGERIAQSGRLIRH